MALKIGLCESPKKFAELVASVVEIPSSITIVDSSTGLLNEGTENQRPWGNLIGVNSELYDKLASIGQEKLCPTFKIKLKSYSGEVLNTYIGCEISLVIMKLLLFLINSSNLSVRHLSSNYQIFQ